MPTVIISIRTGQHRTVSVIPATHLDYHAIKAHMQTDIATWTPLLSHTDLSTVFTAMYGNRHGLRRMPFIMGKTSTGIGQGTLDDLTAWCIVAQIFQPRLLGFFCNLCLLPA